MQRLSRLLITLLMLLMLMVANQASAQSKTQTLRVFVFAGQSNMVGSDSRVEDIKRFPPFAGLEQPQGEVKFSYCIGRENKLRSSGWVDLQPVNNNVGPELSFARLVSQTTEGPIGIIKCAAGGTHLGGDWNPDAPSGFEMYPLLLELVRSSLQELDQQGVPYRLEGFMWHQGENDMFNEGFMADYGKNLKNFMACVRRDLKAPELRFYIGELCTKTIWGMDLRPRMYAISLGQKDAAAADPLAEYVPTSHVGVEIGGGVGLHYHYGTLGQLEHGVNYAEAYLRRINKLPLKRRELNAWPYRKGGQVKLFVLAGHRNMEGERAFVQQLQRVARRGRFDAPQDRYRLHISSRRRIQNVGRLGAARPGGMLRHVRSGAEFRGDAAETCRYAYCDRQIHAQRNTDHRLDAARERGDFPQHLSPIHSIYRRGDPVARGKGTASRAGRRLLSFG